MKPIDAVELCICVCHEPVLANARVASAESAGAVVDRIKMVLASQVLLGMLECFNRVWKREGAGNTFFAMPFDAKKRSLFAKTGSGQTQEPFSEKERGVFCSRRSDASAERWWASPCPCSVVSMHCLRNGPWLRRNAPTVRETTTRKTTRTLFSFLFLRYSFNFLRKKALVLIFGPKMSSGQT